MRRLLWFPEKNISISFKYLLSWERSMNLLTFLSRAYSVSLYIDSGNNTYQTNSTVNPSNSSDGDVRLVGGSTDNEGRVEVYYQGAWGTVCDDYWDFNNTRVVCRQLGLPYDGAISFSSAHFGQGSGPIVLEDIMCDTPRWNVKSRLTSCTFSGWRNQICSHEEDVSVRCGKLNMR